jgi:CrcB protein
VSGVLLWAGVGAIGGGAAILRFVVDGAIASRTERSFPFGTLAVNLSGAAVLGAIAGAALEGDARLLAGTAAVGSYTTFSTWMLETQRLTEEGEPANALVNIVLSLALGLAAVAAGRWIGGRL